MKYISWNSGKNELLKQSRNLSFDELAILIEAGHILEIEENQNYPNQKMYILEIDNYAIVVPFVETEKEIFLKTTFPNRKYTKQFKLTGDHE